MINDFTVQTLTAAPTPTKMTPMSNDKLTSRRSFIKGLGLAGVTGVSTFIHPLRTLARPTYNFTYWRAQSLNIRITQAFAQVALPKPSCEVRLTQEYAQVAFAASSSEMRLTQEYALVAFAPPASELNVTQSYAQVMFPSPDSDLKVTQSYAQVLWI